MRSNNNRRKVNDDEAVMSEPSVSATFHGSDKWNASWEKKALAELVLLNVRADIAENLVLEASDLAVSTGENIESIQGPAKEWVRRRVEELRDDVASNSADDTYEGIPFASDEPWTARLATIYGFVISAVFASFFAVVTLLFDGCRTSLTIPMLMAPIIFGIGNSWLGYIYEATKRRTTFVVATGITTLAFAVVVAVSVLLFTQVKEPRWETLSIAYFGIAAGAGLIAWLISVVWKKPYYDESRAFLRASAIERGDWREEFVRAARIQGGRSEKEIQRLADETYSYAEAAGTTVGQEFGDPVFYAQRLGKNPTVVFRRKFMWRVCVLILAGVLVVTNIIDGNGWVALAWSGLATVFIVWQIVREVRGRNQRR
ncbi:hypothetical protein I6E29_07800 [Arcanobacterium haemolyticum]|nr:hypothetical protein [Arcanobacterium haemolyticum]